MCAWKRILMFLIYFGLTIGIIIGIALPFWVIGWVLFLGLLCCMFSHLLF